MFCLSKLYHYYYKRNKQFGAYRDLKIHKVDGTLSAKILVFPLANGLYKCINS